MGNPTAKPKHTTEELLDRLALKGVKFDLMPRNNAARFLENNNNYFKLTSYRENFPSVKNDEGKNVYLNLDFVHLVEMSRIDMQLRYLLLKMCLDIEHSLKLRIVQLIEKDNAEDGYSIVNDFIATHQNGNKNKIVDAITQCADSPYSRDLLKKHSIDNSSTTIKDFPIWAFVEVISFGSLYSLLKFYYIRRGLSKNGMVDLLYPVRQVRNAAAHNICILNNLYAVHTRTFGPHREVTTIYFHDAYVASDSIRRTRSKELYELTTESIASRGALFSKNDLLLSSYTLLRKISEFLYAKNCV